MAERPAIDRFHEGERAMQRQAGVEATAARVARNIRSSLTPEFGAFLEGQPFVVVAGTDARGANWASLFVGGVGFARALDERRLLLAGTLNASDPLVAAFDDDGARIGILAIEPHSRRRIRVNGRAERSPEGLLVSVDEAFLNCPKYIHRRIPVARLATADGVEHRAGTRLDRSQADLIGAADTFFIASSHPARGADASHRGGPPGFVETASNGTRIAFPDYPGNRMFQTLGNLTADPRIGLLFLDWESGTSLQITGRAEIVWDETRLRGHPSAERLVVVAVDGVREHPGAMPAEWRGLAQAHGSGTA